MNNGTEKTHFNFFVCVGGAFFSLSIVGLMFQREHLWVDVVGAALGLLVGAVFGQPQSARAAKSN